MEWWKCVGKGEPQVNTQKVEPETSRLAELDPKTRSTDGRVLLLIEIAQLW